MSRYLAVSYDPDEQQWFWDVVEAPENESEQVQEYVCKARPYVIGVDVLSADELDLVVGRVLAHKPDWNLSDPLIECPDCCTEHPQSMLRDALAGSGRCPDCGALCHFPEEKKP